MLHHPAEGHLRRRQRLGQLLLGQAGALPAEGLTVVVEERPEGGGLIGPQRRLDTGLGRREGRHDTRLTRRRRPAPCFPPVYLRFEPDSRSGRRSARLLRLRTLVDVAFCPVTV